MKSVLLLLTMATYVIAFEQIIAINSGGEAQTDADGIVYQKYDQNPGVWWNVLELGNVPESDRDIYRLIHNTNKPLSPIKYDIPLKSDGFYLLIAKFSYAWYERRETQSMVLNNQIQLLSNVSLVDLCGGNGKICDVYYYFCVSDKTLYYKNQSVLIQNEKIHIEIRPVIGFANIAGLVLLKGTLGEHQKLVSSATSELVNFDPLNTVNTNSKCLTAPSIVKQLHKTQEGTGEMAVPIAKNLKSNEGGFDY
jgi:Malectin domain